VPDPSASGGYDVLAFFWCPEDDIAQRTQRDRVPYDEWVRGGWLEATPGNVVDYRAIHACILELGRRPGVLAAPYRASASAASRALDGTSEGR
jgi:hypothetical protein